MGVVARRFVPGAVTVGELLFSAATAFGAPVHETCWRIVSIDAKERKKENIVRYSDIQ